MDKFVNSQEQEPHKKTKGLLLFLYWLASFLQWTDEEQKAAGIDFGSLHDNENDK